ncbi:hypothetical protein EW145_g4054 [Phellinidium pouzarii]|uniref:AB hydrolase-1 domain-containing protein n=1 Tax=Phellinidium pouzarii TaxID=167371 RepID=A0A4S4L6B3_9AGAM|nr:hypothetical protein EW145_g4054 [Phellinidium pouzarii]
MVSTELQVQSHILDPRKIGGRILRVTAKHYTLATANKSGNHLVLLLAHGAGMHKEQWQPFLEDLQRFQLESPGGGCEVAEAWAVDCPNHGEGGVVNETELLKNPGSVSCSDYAFSFLALFDTGHLKTSDPRSLVLVGHSAGMATCTIIIRHFIDQKKPLPFVAAIFVDPPPKGAPTSTDDEIEYGTFDTEPFAERALRRKDVWKSKEEAHNFFIKRKPWSDWDPRNLSLYEEFGLRSLPVSYYPDLKEGLTLSCTRIQEGESYHNTVEPKCAVAYLPQLTQFFPVHMIYGGNSPFCPTPEELERLPNSKLIRFASYYVMQNSGHSIPQDHPTALARRFLDVLRRYVGTPEAKGDMISKL